MRQIFEDAVITYWQEAVSLLTIVGLAVVAGPILVIVAASGLSGSIAVLPLFLLLYLLTYAACVRASGLVLSNLGPDPETSWLYAVSRFPDLLRAFAPGGLLLLATAGSTIVVSDQGPALFAAGLVGLLGAVTFLVWSARHAYDQPLMLVNELDAETAVDAGADLTRDSFSWTLLFLGAIGLPLVMAGLLSWALASAITPTFGGAVFALALALWLPLPAITLTSTCARLVEGAQTYSAEA